MLYIYIIYIIYIYIYIHIHIYIYTYTYINNICTTLLIALSVAANFHVTMDAKDGCY